MRQSQLFPKTQKTAPAYADDAGTALLVRGGFIHQVMSGVFTLGPLGFLVQQKITNIIRQEMLAIGASEILMPTLNPREVWQRSGRWDKLTGDMYQFTDASKRELGLSMTHEELHLDLLASQNLSYQDLPLAQFHIQTKYRHEPRAKSGLLRTREFTMKDLYSHHLTEADLLEFYDKVKEAYLRIFARLELPVYYTLASGGIFTDGFSHEFQSPHPLGEDQVYRCPEGDYAFNDEVRDRLETRCPTHGAELKLERTVELGNIFNLGQKFSREMAVHYTAEDGTAQPFWSASYGIGLGRALAMLALVHQDQAGLIWPESVAPYRVHLIDLTREPKDKAEVEALYQRWQSEGRSVLLDDRPVSAGNKFADADLIGLPCRVVVSSRTLANGQLEVKRRSATATDAAELWPLKRQAELFDKSSH